MSAPVPEDLREVYDAAVLDGEAFSEWRSSFVCELIERIAALEGKLTEAQDLAADNFDVVQELRIQKTMMEAQNRALRDALTDAPILDSSDFAPRYRIWTKQARAALAATKPKETK